MIKYNKVSLVHYYLNYIHNIFIFLPTTPNLLSQKKFLLVFVKGYLV